MKRAPYIFFLFALVSVFTPSLVGQEEKTQDKERRDRYLRVDASYVFGGQVYNDNFLYIPGYGFSSSTGVWLNKNIALGLGVGCQFFEDEKFIPIYMDVTAYKKSKSSKKNASFINTQLGYSIGWNPAFSKLETYDFNGGVFINAGVGRNVKINKELSLQFQVSYRHQFAEISYKVSGVKDYSETLNYDMLVLTIGVLFGK